MIAKDIIALVKDAVQDSSITDGHVLGFINQCLLELSAIYPVPSLIVSKTISIAPLSSFVNLPSNYSNCVFSVINSNTQKKLTIYREFSYFLESILSSDAKSIEFCCVTGSKLHFNKPSGAENLIVYYYSYPDTLDSVDSDIPFIPPHLQIPLLFNYSCAECFNLIEDGIEGTKVNQNKYLGFYTAALVKFDAFCGVRESFPSFVV